MIPTIIEVLISLIVIYFLLSTLVSFIFESIAMAFNSKGKLLKRALIHFFEEKVGKNEKPTSKFIENIYTSKLLKSIPTKFLGLEFKNQLPHEINIKEFANAFVKQLGNEMEESKDLSNYKDLKLSNPYLEKMISEFINDINDEKGEKGGINDLKIKIEDWITGLMKPISIFYKSQAKIIMFIISFFVVLTMNIDSLVLFEYFYENKDKREMMVNYAENIDVSSYEMDSSLTAFQKSDTINKHKASIIKDINSFELPIGWQSNEKKELSSSCDWDLVNKFIGLLITMILLTLGAPFWYEMMVKMLDWRNKIKNPKTK